MYRLSRILCLTLLVLLFAFPLGVWIAAMLGFNVQNPFGDEALRWFFRHGPEALSPMWLGQFILLLSAIGSVQESKVITRLLSGKATFYLPCMRYAIVTFFVILLVLVISVLLPQSGLLSVTGRLFPSPWLCGFPSGFFVDVIISSCVYACFDGSERGLMDVPRILSSGISRYGVWIVNFMMACLLKSMIEYTM